MVHMEQKPAANPAIVLYEEFDDLAILFDPDTGESFGLNPVSAFIWKQLDGKHSVGAIAASLREACADAPPESAAHVSAFIAALLAKGLAGVAHTQRGGNDAASRK